MRRGETQHLWQSPLMDVITKEYRIHWPKNILLGQGCSIYVACLPSKIQPASTSQTASIKDMHCAKEMARWLRAYTALPEDLSLALSTHVGWLKAAKSKLQIPGTWHLLLSSAETWEYAWETDRHIHTHRHIHANKLKKKKTLEAYMSCKWSE